MGMGVNEIDSTNVEYNYTSEYYVIQTTNISLKGVTCDVSK